MNEKITIEATKPKRTVSAAELTKNLLELLGLKPGDSFELAKLRNGNVMVSKTDQARNESTDSLSDSMSDSRRVGRVRRF